MVRLHPRTGVHDRQILERHAEKFLRSGHKVRVVCQFRGRENAHPEIGRAQLDAVAQALEEVATVEGTIIKQGRDMTMFMVPKPGVKPLPKLVKPTGKNMTVHAEVEEEDEELDEYSAPGVEDDDEHDDDEHGDADVEAEAAIAPVEDDGLVDDESEITNNVQTHKGR
jgi:translation initiation factor IF-3